MLGTWDNLSVELHGDMAALEAQLVEQPGDGRLGGEGVGATVENDLGHRGRVTHHGGQMPVRGTAEPLAQPRTQMWFMCNRSHQV